MLKANSSHFLTSKKLFMMTLHIVLSFKLFPVQSLQLEITFKQPSLSSFALIFWFSLNVYFCTDVSSIL